MAGVERVLGALQAEVKNGAKQMESFAQRVEERFDRVDKKILEIQKWQWTTVGKQQVISAITALIMTGLIEAIIHFT